MITISSRSGSCSRQTDEQLNSKICWLCGILAAGEKKKRDILLKQNVYRSRERNLQIRIDLMIILTRFKTYFISFLYFKQDRVCLLSYRFECQRHPWGKSKPRQNPDRSLTTFGISLPPYLDYKAMVIKLNTT